MYRHILIPTDGSYGARRGSERGLELATEHGATVHALFVLDERRYGNTPALSSEELALERIERHGERLLAEIADEAARRGLDARVSCVRGLPHEEIVAYATTNDVDLIVMGIHGIHGGRRPDRRGVTDRVTRTVPATVEAV